MGDGWLVSSFSGIKVLARNQASVLPFPRADTSILVIESPAQLHTLVPQSHELITVRIDILASVLKFTICPVALVRVSICQLDDAEAVLLAALPVSDVAFTRGLGCLPFAMAVRLTVLPLTCVGRPIRIDPHPEALRDRTLVMRVSLKAPPVLCDAAVGGSGREATTHHAFREMLMVKNSETSGAIRKVPVDDLEVIHLFEAFQRCVQGLGHGASVPFFGLGRFSWSFFRGRLHDAIIFEKLRSPFLCHCGLTWKTVRRT
mmetsp:Transcript_54354/g.75307  ORF Transcript_54354/g.75307 Transcript_54354/m.75307 type:complete len:260 (+) Transcript_54354:337-1116(+)